MKLSLEGQVELIGEFTRFVWFTDISAIPFTITSVVDIEGPTITLRVRGEEVTDQDMRIIKHLFGPLVFENLYGTTNATGKKMEQYMPEIPPLTIKIEVVGAMTCTPDVAEEGVANAAQIEKLVAQFEAGEIKLQHCTAMQHIDEKELCTNRLCRGKGMREGLCYECYNDAQHDLMQRELMEQSSKLKS